MTADLLNAEPVEMTSESLSETKFSQMSDEPLQDGLVDLIIYGGDAGSSFAAKVRLFSMDVNKPTIHFADNVTLSMGSVPGFIVPAFLTLDFDDCKLVTKYFSVTLTPGNINRVSFNEEDADTCSLILDVSSPSFSKSGLEE